MTAYQLGRAHAQLTKEARRPLEPLLPAVLRRLGVWGTKGLYHLDPALMRTVSQRYRAQDIGAIGAGLGLGTLGHMLSSDQKPQPPGIQQGYLPPGIQ